MESFEIVQVRGNLILIIRLGNISHQYLLLTLISRPVLKRTKETCDERTVQNIPRLSGMFSCGRIDLNRTLLTPKDNRKIKSSLPILLNTLIGIFFTATHLFIYFARLINHRVLDQISPFFKIALNHRDLIKTIQLMTFTHDSPFVAEITNEMHTHVKHL